MANSDVSGIRIKPDALRSLASASMTGSYQAVGSALTHQSRIAKFTNNTNQDITLSWDGTTDNEFIPSGSFVLLDVTANIDANEDQLLIPAGVVFYAKGTAGTGSFYISTYYSF